jgi:uncharacterized membrane protein YfcA
VSFETFLIVASGGLFVGIFSGMFGIGGGTMIVPLLHLAFGVPVLGAASTSLFTIAPTAISGASKHIRLKTVDAKAGVLIGVAGALTSALGAWLSDYLSDMVLVLLTAAVILYSAIRMIARSGKPDAGTAAAANTAASTADANTTAAAAAAADTAAAATTVAAASTANTADAAATATVAAAATTTVAAAAADTAAASSTATTASSPVLSSRQNVIAVTVGLFAGLLAGLAGVGGGFIIVPLGIAFLGFSMYRAVGTSLIAIAIIAIPGIISHALLGHIWYLYGLALMVGTIPGAQLGARLAMRLPERVLRCAFGVLLIFSGCMLVLNQVIAGGGAV